MSDFYFNGGRLEYGTPRERFDRNMAAIKLYKELESTGRAAVEEEQKVLANYIGWGDSRIAKWANELKEVVTEDELKSANASMLNAHFTALPVVDAMWKALLRLGIADLPRIRGLESAMGVGNFISSTPESIRDRIEWTGVELDTLTAGIAKYIHPTKRILNVGFEAANLPDGIFDFAISNVPFGNFPVFSKRDMPKAAKSSIHDFFFANTYFLLKPGGVLAYITSRFTMDKKSDIVRRWLAERFMFLDAIRLPSNAFMENAGTEVVTDILLLQKIWSDTPNTVAEHWDGPGNWVDTGVWRRNYNNTIYINKYFLEHPEKVLGEQDMTGSMYRGGDGYNVRLREGQNLPEMLDKALSHFSPMEWYPPAEIADVSKEEKPTEAIVMEQESESPIVKALMVIYKNAKNLLRAEVAGDSETENLRTVLNWNYDEFYKQYGPIANNISKMRSAEAFFLKALEKDGRKADIFTRTVIRTGHVVENPTLHDILLMSLDKFGKVNLTFISDRIGKSVEDVIEELGEQIFLDPNTKQWLTADQYLSGNVRVKLRQAQAISEYDESFKRNVKALEAVIPLDIPAGSIRVPLGAGWVPIKYMHDFILHLLEGGQYSVKYNKKLASWNIAITNWYGVNRSNLMTRWGTARISTIDLLEAGLNAQRPQIYDGTGDDRVLNTKETAAAQNKLEEIKEEFEKWLWQDADRAADLVHIYNEEFNAIRNVEYNGAHLSTPGLNKFDRKGDPLTLRSNQKDAAWRAIQQQCTGFMHEVGMGKTLAAIVAAMESKRLGLIKKAMIVVPNHTMYGEDSWSSALVNAYPGANILIPEPSDLNSKNRQKFMSTIATNDWDIVLVPFSSFKLLPPSNERMKEYYMMQKDELRDAFEEAKADNDYGSQKDLERALKRLDVKLEKLADFKRDDEKAVSWEELGIDMLIVDEFHAFKNLFFVTKMSRIAGLPNADSQRAFDMFLKFRFTIEAGGKVLVLTGTPVTNTIAEMFTMQRYLQLMTLQEVGIELFDAWVRQFALAEEGLEMTPDGAGFRMNTRFRKFVNIPELMQLWLQVADVRRIEGSTEIQRPILYHGKPVKVVVSAGEALERFVKHLASRAEKIRAGLVKPWEDNMLKITSEGRKAALDMSLVIPSMPNAAMPKIDRLAEVVKRVADITKEVKGTQLIFCDLATPKGKAEKAEAKEKKVTKEKDVTIIESEDELEVASIETAEEIAITVNIYNDIKMRLVKLGMSASEIAFIHDAKNPKEKTELQRKVNDGTIRVLIGSNEKMGTGLNVQTRLVATHLITPPWRPGDIEQQIGRMWRQGNLFPTVFNFVHVTEKSFEGYIWQLLENKAGFIAQVAKGKVTDREIEDVGDVTLNYKEIKGLASGNPKVMLKVQLDQDMFRLNSVRQSWMSSQFLMRQEIKYKTQLIEEDKAHMEALKDAILVRDNNTKKDEKGKEIFEIEILPNFGADHYVTETDKEKVGSRLRMLAEQAAYKVLHTAGVKHYVIAKYRGHNIYATATKLNQITTEGQIASTNTSMIYYEVFDRPITINGMDGKGLFISMQAGLRNLSEKLQNLELQNADRAKQIANMEEELNKPWDLQEKFDRVATELAEVNAELQHKGEDVEIKVEARNNLAIEESEKDLAQALRDIEFMMSDPETLKRFGIGVEKRVDPIQVKPIDLVAPPVIADVSISKVPTKKVRTVKVPKDSNPQQLSMDLDSLMKNAVQLNLFQF